MTDAPNKSDALVANGLVKRFGNRVAVNGVSTLVGLLFVLTPNALAYESLLGVPLVLLSGVLGTPDFIAAPVLLLALALPTRSALANIFATTSSGGGNHLSLSGLAVTIGVSLVWIGAAVVVANYVTKRATKAGTLDLI